MHRSTLGTFSMVLALGVFAVGCGPRDMPYEDTATGAVGGTGGTATAGGDVATAPAPITDVADIVGNPEQYLNQTVTVEADVEEVLSEFAFALDEDNPVQGGIDNDLLVFSPKSGQLAGIDDQWLDNRVRVTGTVHRMTVAELEREIEWDLDRTIEAKLEEPRPVIIAASVERVNR